MPLDPETAFELKAILKAQVRVDERIEAGEITTLEGLEAALKEEIEFQRIAVREN